MSSNQWRDRSGRLYRCERIYFFNLLYILLNFNAIYLFLVGFINICIVEI